jgi:tetratricopeptide (TPR) repeat protein
MEVTMASIVKRRQKYEMRRHFFWPVLTVIVSFSILILFTILVAGCNENNRATEINTTKQISPEERKAQLLKSLDRRFENPDAHFQLGQLYHAERNFSQAEWHYNRALNFDPVYWPAKAALVKLYIDSGDPSKAKNIADDYINKVSISAAQSLELALAFQNEKLDTYAMICFQQALNLAPNSPEIHKKLGYYYLSRNEKEQAKEYFTRSFQLNPNQPEVAGELGRLGVEVRIPTNPGQNINKPENINN